MTIYNNTKFSDITETDYQYFRKRVALWRDYFGILNFVIATEFKDLGDKNILAQCNPDVTGRIATLTLNSVTDLPTEDNDRIQRICACAFHEVWHILLSEITYPIRVRMSSSEMVEFQKLEESLIRIMENTIHHDIIELRNFKKDKQYEKDPNIPEKVTIDSGIDARRECPYNEPASPVNKRDAQEIIDFNNGVPLGSVKQGRSIS